MKTIKELEEEMQGAFECDEVDTTTFINMLNANIEILKDVLGYIDEAVKTLKNNYSHLEKNRDNAIGILNRFDELGLIYSDIKGISFNEAMEELELKDFMEELKARITG